MINVPEWCQHDVSRETLDDLIAFDTLVQTWSPKINLVSRGDLSDLWGRHIWDSVQLWQNRPSSATLWFDLGSGGGFPGLVLAMLAKHNCPNLKIHLIESDQRKCAFLRTVVRTLDLNAKINAARTDQVTLRDADVISARALAGLPELLEMACPLAKTSTTFLFPKGVRWKSEVQMALEKWRFEYNAHQSHTDKDACLLELRNVFAN